MRRRRAEVREVNADPVFNSTLIEKFVNSMMWDGKKAVAHGIFYQAMNQIQEKTGEEPLKVFKKAIESAKPVLEVKTRRVGGANYQVPMQVNRRRQQSLAFRWLITAARDKKGKPMAVRLAAELADAYNNTGAAVTTKENVHRMADANKAFAHFAW